MYRFYAFMMMTMMIIMIVRPDGTISTSCDVTCSPLITSDMRKRRPARPAIFCGREEERVGSDTIGLYNNPV